MAKNRRHFSLIRTAKRRHFNLISMALPSRGKKHSRSRRPTTGRLACRNAAEAETTSPVNVPPRLCTVCDGMFTGLLVVRSYMPHHQSVANLRRSAERGCYICNLVVANLQNQVSSGLQLPRDHRYRWQLHLYSYNYQESQDEFYRDYGTLSISSDLDECVLKLMDAKSPNAPIHSVISGASLTDQAVLENARAWLKDCRQHDALCEPVDPTFNPTRLIYIHDTSSVQLIETKKDSKSFPYVAFSHCWGKSKHLTLLQDEPNGTTKGNIEELRSLIQVQRLPTSYREGISVSLALGFRHIWIDSLCIIQNSRDDWAKEAAMMKDVYANSSINICASAAADSSEASFQRRDLSMLSPLDVEPQWTGLLDCDDIESELGPLPAYLQRIKFKLVNTSMYESDLSNAPLNLRAWVFQERTLSRRHLYMTCNQLWWECRGMCACEVFPAGIPDRLDPSRTDTDEGYRVQYYALGGHRHHSIDNGAALDSSSAGQRKRVTQGELARHAPFSGPSEVDMYELWNRLVERYSQCNITYSSDKLPALSGLAQSFSILQGSGFALNGQSYLAGVWRPHLPEALYWKPKPPLRGDVPFGRNRPHPYRAPSWSWSSVESPVEWINSGQFTEPACRVEDVKVLHLDERYEAGMVKGGILHLRSRLIGPFTYEESPLMNLTPSPALDSRVRVALCSAEKECVTCWDERDFDSQKWCISYLDPLPDTVHEDGILNGTETVRKTVSLEASAKDPRIRLFLVPLFQRWGFAGVILCQVVVDETDLECADDRAVFQRVGSFAYMEIEKKVLDLIPERTIAII